MKQIQFISTSPSYLIDLIDETLKKRLDSFAENYTPYKPEEYMSRSEVSKWLKVDESTVHNWRVKNIIEAVQLGGRVFYKRSQIEQALVKLKK
jgi:hypothetical protein